MKRTRRPADPPTRRAHAAVALLLALAATACGRVINYPDRNGPRYVANHVAAPPAARCLRMVSFNIAFGQFPDRAVALLRKDTVLRRVDVLLLQEVDADATRLIADSLGMSFVYYPAARHPFTGRDFGNAILARWPLQDDAKLVLPHRAKFGGSQRIAVAATMRFGEQPVRIYSLHLATGITTGHAQREEQLRVVIEDAEHYSHAVIGGDYNSESLPKLGIEMGLRWPTRRLPATAAFWTVDHLLLRDMALCRPASTGVRNDPFDTSDHLPIWADLALEPALPASPASLAR